jgi:3-isopropylmalate dehydrogenase
MIQIPPRTLVATTNIVMPLTYKIAVLAGDGIGPEVMAEAIALLQRCAELDQFHLDLNESLVGGAAIDKTGKALPKETLSNCEGSDAILFGSVGGPKWERCRPASNRNAPRFYPCANIFSCSPTCGRLFVCLSCRLPHR